jgi:DNA-binding transcriptional LysR family regulator
LLPATHPLAAAPAVTPGQLQHDTWIRAHQGSAARLIDHVLHRAGLHPAITHAGQGDEPVEAQAFVAAGHGITLAHRLNVLLDPSRITAVPLAGDAPIRHIQAASGRAKETSGTSMAEPLMAVMASGGAARRGPSG